MQCPIDLNELSLPIREKYLIDENPDFAPWIIFGEHEDGTVDVHQSCDGRDIFVRVDKEKAEALVKLRAEFGNKLLNIVNGKIPAHE